MDHGKTRSPHLFEPAAPTEPDAKLLEDAVQQLLEHGPDYDVKPTAENYDSWATWEKYSS
jgi:hypothetical protein